MKLQNQNFHLFYFLGFEALLDALIKKGQKSLNPILNSATRMGKLKLCDIIDLDTALNYS